jgi:hypothetical protein
VGNDAAMLLYPDGFPTGTVAIAEVNHVPPLCRSGRIPPAPTAHRDGHMQFAQLQADGTGSYAGCTNASYGSNILPPSYRLKKVSGYHGGRLKLASAPFGTLDISTAHHGTIRSARLRAHLESGSMLATMVCEPDMRRSFSEHRNALRTNVEYALRSRDPAV